MDQSFIESLLENTIDPNLSLPDPNLIQYYTDLKKRHYWIDGEITDKYLDLVQKILEWNRVDQNLPTTGRKPIKIFFNSPGGSLDVADTLTHIIELSETPVYGVALGMVASAASIIYLSCHKRYSLSNGSFLIHKGSCSNISGEYAQIAAFMSDYEKTVQKMVEFYKGHTSFAPDYIESKMNGADWYVYLDEAFQYGLVTDKVEDISVLL